MIVAHDLGQRQGWGDVVVGDRARIRHAWLHRDVAVQIAGAAELGRIAGWPALCDRVCAFGDVGRHA